MPAIKSDHNLIKIGKRQYRNPIYLAKEWQKTLDNGEYASHAALARHLKVSKARITQIMNLLKLSPEAIEIIDSLGDPISGPILTERKLRKVLGLSARKQRVWIKTILLEQRSDQS
jgi:hypothetical protein